MSRTLTSAVIYTASACVYFTARTPRHFTVTIRTFRTASRAAMIRTIPLITARLSTLLPMIHAIHFLVYVFGVVHVKLVDVTGVEPVKPGSTVELYAQRLRIFCEKFITKKFHHNFKVFFFLFSLNNFRASKFKISFGIRIRRTESTPETFFL